MLSRFFRRSPDISAIELIFISKDECSLCDTALKTVEALRREHPFRLRVVKIVPGDEWYDRYRESIPVGLVDGGMVFKYRTTREELLRKLQARLGASRG